jgi:site-specific DNA recombinase
MKNGIKYFVYIRRSMDDDDRQVLSLPAQTSSLNKVTKDNGLCLFETFEESRTAKKPGRVEFNRMLDRIEAGEANGILCWDIDRLYRNPIDEGRVRWLLQNGVLQSVRTPGRDYTPRDAGLLMAVEGGRAVEHILSMARNLKRTFDEKLKRGQWPGRAVVGYLFDHRVKNIVPHPEKAKIVRELFEEFSKGRLGFESGARWLAERGIRSKCGTPFSKSQMWQLLTNRLYMGLMEWKGETYEGKFTSIVPADLFDKVQKVMKVKSKPRKVRNGHNFPFCGLFRCTCGAMITAQWAKGHGGVYRYYRCSRKITAQCHEPYLREEHLTSQCLDKLRPFALLPAEATEIVNLIESMAESERAAKSQGIQQMTEALEPIEEKLRKLTRHLLDEIIDEDSYRIAKEELLVEKTRLKQERQHLNRTGENSWVEPAKRFVNSLKTLGETDVGNNLPEISGLVHDFGTNRLISRKTVSFSVAEKYDSIPSLLASVRMLPASVLPTGDVQNHESLKWCPVVNHIRTLFQQ